MDNNIQNNMSPDMLPATTSKQPSPMVAIIAAVAVAIAGVLWWQMGDKDTSPMPTVSQTPAFDQDTQSDLQEIDAASEADLDTEFQTIDQGINEL